MTDRETLENIVIVLSTGRAGANTVIAVLCLAVDLAMSLHSYGVTIEKIERNRELNSVTCCV